MFVYSVNRFIRRNAYNISVSKRNTRDKQPGGTTMKTNYKGWTIQKVKGTDYSWTATKDGAIYIINAFTMTEAKRTLDEQLAK